MEDKHYYLESDRVFPTVLQWLQTQVKAGRLVLNGRSEARCNGILRGGVSASSQWDRAFDFFRTATSVMKLAMMKATRLQELYNPSFYYKVDNDPQIKVSWPDEACKKEINYGGHLANDKSEAKKLWKKFGELYDYSIVNEALTSKPKGKFLPLCNFEKEMIVVCETTGSVWHIKSCLRVETNGDVITRGALFVTVFRYDLAAGQSLVDINPFQPPDQPGIVLAKKKPDLSFDELVESVKKLDISPKGRSKE